MLLLLDEDAYMKENNWVVFSPLLEKVDLYFKEMRRDYYKDLLDWALDSKILKNSYN